MEGCHASVYDEKSPSGHTMKSRSGRGHRSWQIVREPLRDQVSWYLDGDGRDEMEKQFQRQRQSGFFGTWVIGEKRELSDYE